MASEQEFDSEYLREVLLDLERSRNFERELRRESESLLAGLKILALSESLDQTFQQLLEALRGAFSYLDAFVLSRSGPGCLQLLATTDSRFGSGNWAPGELFRRVFAGNPVAVFDLDRVPEWQAQPESVRSGTRSALLIPLQGMQHQAMLVATHSQLGFFTRHHVQLASRLALLASQALRQSELQNQLRYQQELIRNVLDALPAMVDVQDASGKLTLTNQKVHELLGAQALEQLMALPLPEQADWSRVVQFDRAQPSYELEEMLPIQDGSMHWFQTITKPLLSPEGEIFTLRVRTDITQRKQGEHVLEQANFRMQKAMLAAKDASEAKSQFLANMSHELRTPLNAIIGFANLVLKRKDTGLTARDWHFLERLQQNSMDLLTLINELLDLAKIESGSIDLNPQPVELGALLQQVLEQYGVLAEQKHLKLIGIGLQPGLPLQADPDKLKQIVINLLSNALKFTNQGTIKVIFKRDKQGQPLSLTVKDSGIGIPADKLSSIFEPFYQVQNNTRRSYQGTGLGLAISYSLCEMLGFRLEVRSQLGYGSSFRICFRSSPAKPLLKARKAAGDIPAP